MIDKERVRKYGEVFTPGWMAAQMCDQLEQENPDAFLPEKTFLEPTCGRGVFLCWRTMWRNPSDR